MSPSTTDGKIRAAARPTGSLRAFAPPMREQVAGNGVRLLSGSSCRPAAIQVRLAARNSAGGAVGSVIGDLEVPDYDQLPFSMSHLLIASAAELARPDAAS